jgi:hypothetical protein
MVVSDKGGGAVSQMLRDERSMSPGCDVKRAIKISAQMFIKLSKES